MGAGSDELDLPRMRRPQGRLRDGSDLNRWRFTSSDDAAPEQLHKEQRQVSTTGLKVLVIDDSNTIRRSAEIFLKQGGHDVLLAEDGFDALAKVNDYQPNLIFCDILMPRLDGYQTCAIIKRNAKFASVPVVMLSSKDGVFDKARGRMVGSQDYLTKPFTKDQLLQTVQQFGAAKQGVM
jgi:twitching motility two-component system response regulator PilG